ncbi:iron complex transport system permease protein [Thermosporothrix hazakensis]|jgi:iron complex transport system permease protein|uniref:Iron complex transport system permease protein n=1 Tax=Thermosporothrix hazakensis TaxID=644383 RepID=A0A326UIQ9_THEHA|nr:iron ABC transporter permease [Thermosporothrix hazakensis]PZW32018.1 iron complex transport system permease protein [Thermosporothrix hazakensis]GCE49654.1 iron ABC transporter permease [Thermosporothrix hazakensis]
MRDWFVFRSKALPLSFRVKRNVPLVLLILLVLILAVSVISISVGEFQISIPDVLATPFGAGDKRFTFIIMRLRLPRALIAIFVGMAIAASGAILQGLTRNPLASPDIIGISHGASLAAVGLIIFASWISITFVPVAAFLGAGVAALLVYLLAWRKGSSPIRLILVGIGLSAIASALVQIMISTSEIFRVNQALVWLVGSIYGRSWGEFWALVPWLVIFLPLAFFLARHLDALHLGDDLARGLGSNIERLRLILLITAVALAGSSVATAGTIAFVGLMAPHIARLLVGPSHNGLLPTASLLGALIVALADLLGRVLFAPIEVPCGVITAAIGAPYFIWLLLRSRNL